jgi:hypothetical protein
MVNLMDMDCVFQKKEIFTTKVSGLMINYLEKEDCLNLVFFSNTKGTF